MLLASLNHPDIASIYGLEESDGVKALVLELVEGPTLAERIGRGPIPVDEAIAIAKQIAEALEAGHEAGVIHRDLKPANIKLKEDGTVKVLDYGLAKALGTDDSASGGESELSQSPTLTRQGTQIGVILGTAAYMSPEQARGTAVDRRTDIWSFGCCLFEALTGRRAFEGEHVTDVLAAVMRAEPEFSALRSANLRRIAERCLRKDRSYQHIGDVRIALEDPIPVEAKSDRRPMLVPLLLTAIATAALSALFWSAFDRSPPTDVHTMESSIELPADRRLHTRFDMPGLALTPDGGRLVFIGGTAESRQVFVRAMSERAVLPVAGTEGVEDTALCVSPDGEWVAFYRDETLWRTPIEGGIPVPILESREPIESARWFQDDTIVFRQGLFSPLSRVAADGGEPEAVTEFDQAQSENESHSSPRMLPGGDALLFSVSVGNAEATHIEVLSLQSRERKRILDDAYFVEYVRSGHLIYGRQETLFAVGEIKPYRTAYRRG